MTTRVTCAKPEDAPEFLPEGLIAHPEMGWTPARLGLILGDLPYPQNPLWHRRLAGSVHGAAGLGLMTSSLFYFDGIL